MNYVYWIHLADNKDTKEGEIGITRDLNKQFEKFTVSMNAYNKGLWVVSKLFESTKLETCILQLLKYRPGHALEAKLVKSKRKIKLAANKDKVHSVYWMHRVEETDAGSEGILGVTADFEGNRKAKLDTMDDELGKLMVYEKVFEGSVEECRAERDRLRGLDVPLWEKYL